MEVADRKHVLSVRLSDREVQLVDEILHAAGSNDQIPPSVSGIVREAIRLYHVRCFGSTALTVVSRGRRTF